MEEERLEAAERDEVKPPPRWFYLLLLIGLGGFILVIDPLLGWLFGGR